MKIKYWLAFGALLCSCIGVLGQAKIKSLKIGDDASNLILKQVRNYPKQELPLSSLKGKFVLLDFWTGGCASCFEAMPKLEALQKKFSNDLEIILINPWEQEDRTLKRLAAMRKLDPKFALPKLPYILGDTIWRHVFPHRIVPHHIWIDRQGKIIATTNGWNADEKHIKDLIAGKHVDFAIKNDFTLTELSDNTAALLRAADSSVTPDYYSTILRYNQGLRARNDSEIDSVKGTLRMYRRNASILNLFKDAFGVPFYEHKRILLEVSDPSVLQFPKDLGGMDRFLAENCYSYELLIPVAWRSNANQMMAEDLNRYFKMKRGIIAAMEDRLYPAYVLTSLPSYRQESKDNRDSIITTDNTYLYINQPVKMLEEYLRNTLEDFSQPIAFVSELSYKDTDRITVEVPRDWTDINKGIDMLKKQGLLLKKEERKIKMLVIKNIAKTSRE